MFAVKYLVVIGLLFLASANAHSGDPRWVSIGQIPSERSGHAAVQVHTGDVVVFGGVTSTGAVNADSWIIRSKTGVIEQTLNGLSNPVCYPAVVEVKDANGESRVYSIGGYTVGGATFRSTDAISLLTYNAAQDNWRWVTVGRLPVPLAECRAVFDGDRSIVVSGGYEQAGGARASGVRSVVACIIDIPTGNVVRIDDHQTARAAHGAYRFLNQNGDEVVMVAGGEDATPATELLDNTSWDPRANAPLNLRSNAYTVSDYQQVARAFGGKDGSGIPYASCEWYDPKSGWRNAPPMGEARTEFSGTLAAGLTDTAGVYLVGGGDGIGGPLGSTEMFFLPSQSDPAGSWTPFHTFIDASASRPIACLGNNLPVVAGGTDTRGVEILQPLRVVDVNFPPTEVGARSDSIRLTVTNTWVLPVTIDSFSIDSPEFLGSSVSGPLTISPDGSASILVWFRPAQAGTRTGTLTLDMGSVKEEVSLTGNGLASTISVVTTDVDHGEVFVGDKDTVCIPFLRNEGTDTTYIDSIQITPAGANVRVLSPSGKTPVAPGEELEVCFEYSPLAREQLAASAFAHIGPRSYPVAVVGKGIRVTGVVQANSDCDTISAQRDDLVVLVATLRNIGDRDVQIDRIDLNTSVPGIANVIDPNTFPVIIPPGGSIPLQVELSIQREGREVVGVECVSNSDSLMSGQLCVTTSAGSLQLSSSNIEVGTLCVGDVVRTSVTVTNASASETINVSDVLVENTDQVEISDNSGFILMPRESKSFDLTVTASQSGPLDARIVFVTPKGSSVIAVTGTVGQDITLDLPDIAIRPGQTQRLPVTVTGMTGDVLAFRLLHGTTELNISGIETANGEPPVDPASSTIRTTSWTEMELRMQAPAGGADFTFDMVVEGLRGEDNSTRMYAEALPDPVDCVTSDTATVIVSDTCGTYGGVRAGQGANALVMPSITEGMVRIDVASTLDDELTMTIVDVNGAIVLSASVPRVQQRVHSIMTFDLNQCSTGLYAVQLLSSRGLEDVTTFMVAR